MWTRSLLLLCLFTCMIMSCKTVGVQFTHSISRAQQSSLYCYTFKNLLEFFILLYFCKSYLLKLFFCPSTLFKSLSKHVTIVVHENCWDSLKAPPDFFTFMWYSSSTWSITTFPVMQDISDKNFSDMRYKTSKAFATHV